MRWEDEHWVKLYTRDTLDWQAIGWEAHAVWFEVFRKLDTAGVLDLGKHGAKGFAVAIGMPVDILDRGLKALLDDGCLVLNGSLLVMPNYVEAQEARKSDRLRQRDSRARARDDAMSHDVTTPSRGVTPRDELSREQNACHVSGATSAEENRGEVNRSEEIPPTPQGGRKRREYSDSFEVAWKLYVRGEDKSGAFVEWGKRARDFQGGESELLATVKAALLWQVPAWKASDSEFPKHQVWFSRYLKRGRWEDEKTQPSNTNRGTRPQDEPVFWNKA